MNKQTAINFVGIVVMGVLCIIIMNRAIEMRDNTYSKLDDLVLQIREINGNTETMLEEKQEIDKRISVIPGDGPKEVKEIKQVDVYFPTEGKMNGDGNFYIHIPPTGNYLVNKVNFYTGNR